MFRLSMLSTLTSTLLLAQTPQQPPPQQPQTQAQPPAQTQAPPVSFGPISLQNVSLTEVIDLLARQLKINITYDPGIKGSVMLNTYGETKNLDARTLLDMLLRINGYGMVQVGEVYRI